MRKIKTFGTGGFRAAALGVVLLLGACTARYENHGYVPPEDQLNTIVVGTDTKETVVEKVGVPTSSGVLSDGGYYYVRMRQRSFGFMAAKEIDREVVAISFSGNGVVQNVERFGLERGQVVTLSRRVTSSAVSDTTFLRQLLGNIGQFAPGGFGSE